ncbi:hypothetical protein [Marinobacter halotolerans]|uniref:hypothetical protein n=1 Tax=Marinobacter halotolerans TaxID=1569211 RepID=UPI001248660A|nr:hypothetical protein [Marinobacter halotolerans]
MRIAGWHRILLPVLAATLAGCGSDGGDGTPGGQDSGTAAQGESQKGPFQQGAGATARNLLADGTIGSQSASTSTTDGRGSYQFDSLGWQGGTRIRIEGTFFDEVTGTFSSESRYLDAMMLAGEANGTNINLYTHIQSARIQALMQSGKSFSDARDQARQEWQTIAGTQTPASALDILDGQSGSAESDNANLLLFSAAALQAGLDQQALNSLRDDFADDGQINGAAQSTYSSIVSAGQTPDLLADARANLVAEFGGDPADGSSLGFAWIPGACEQTRLAVSNRQVFCSGDDPIQNLNSNSPDDSRVAAAMIFEKPGHYRVEVSGISGDAYSGNNWKLFRFDDQDTNRLCDNSTETSEAIGRSVIEGLTDRMDPDERKCLELYFAPAANNGGPTEFDIGLVPINDGGPALDEAVPLALGQNHAGKIGNYVTGASDFPAYSYYRFSAPTDGTYRITVNGYANLGSGSMRISLFTDQDNSGGITFFNDQERIDFTGGPGTDSKETVMEKSLGAGTYVVRVFNGTGYRATMEGATYYLTGLDLNITVDSL